MSSTQQADTQMAEIDSVFHRLTGMPAISIGSLGGGRNSQVYQLTCADSRKYALKRHFRRDAGGRDPLATEFLALEFLWNNGVRCVPQPIAVDAEFGAAVYAFVDGQQVSSLDVDELDIGQAVRFLARLKELATGDGSLLLPPASSLPPRPSTSTSGSTRLRL